MKLIKQQLFLITVVLFGVSILFYLAYISVPTNNHHRAAFEYVVQPNDTCPGIADKGNVSIISIIEANKLLPDCSDIYLGQKLTIPYPTSTPFGFADVTHVVTECEKVFYSVKKGDSVSTIAEDYNIPQQAIKFFNGLDKDVLTPGTEIIVPLCVRTPRYIDPTPTATFTIP